MVTLGVDHDEFATLQASCLDIQAPQTASTILHLTDVLLSRDTPLLCYVSCGQLHWMVPQEFSHQVFDMLHCLSYPSVSVSKHFIGEHFMWNGMQREIAA